ncbi:TetR/AcrR family transcriptional regulator [Antrihabitans cavernicola]|uniref:TetR/AcrR family transcriptional regulator n=1 Tax=Antrihabitans cavernicola TaxID=2495913 RepID=A0A5A7SDC5_9NOCA|nr:TetR/AcrR family transcriptional regulator [Spelaeibacter cavernicola]KAA0023379.1 TetR/AcrR family transcriptional regulator [Spelaeibacter cavernicola]
MARPLDHDRRAELLAGTVRYIGTHGLTDLSLRPLAAELGTSSRMLIYYFGTKEELLIQALTTHRPDISSLFADVTDADGLRWRLQHMGSSLTDGETSTSTRVLLQVMGAACVEKHGPFAEYVIDAVAVLVTELAAVLHRLDDPPADPIATATVLISGMRGIMLDRFLTDDIDRTDRAARLLVDQVLATMGHNHHHGAERVGPDSPV